MISRFRLARTFPVPWAWFFFLMLLVPFLQAAEQQRLPTAEIVLDKFVEVTGGRMAYEKIHSQVAQGIVEVAAAGVKGTITSYEAEPNKVYIVIEIDGVGKVEEGTDGQVAWERSALQGPRVKTGEERAIAVREATFNARIRWREMYTKAECVGIETIGDQPCYKIVLTPAEGKPVTQYYDVKSNLLVKTSMIVKSPMGEIPMESLISDYRQVDGIQEAHKLVQKALTQEIHVTVESIRFNVDLPKDRFDAPEEIKALAAKAKGSEK